MAETLQIIHLEVDTHIYSATPFARLPGVSVKIGGPIAERVPF